ncbi:MAG: hypothetical protein SO170_02895 [Butyribacter sp.]|nr:hypothetical protein [bacterium]MDY3853901.1 hypothetical protein [Butyribacter sp.]
MKKTVLHIICGSLLLLLCLVPADKTSARRNRSLALASQTNNTEQSSFANSAEQSSSDDQASIDQAFLPLQETSATTIKLKQKKAAPKVGISKHAKKIFQNDSDTLSVFNVPKDCSVTFKSSDSSILKVEQDSDTSCRYTGIKSGSAKVIIKITKTNFLFFEDTKTINAKISVSPRAASIMFHQSVRKIRKGQKVKMAVTLRPSITKERPFFWSANKQIVSIGSKGVIHGKKVGTTYVMARISNGKTAKCKIIVRKKKASEK